MNLENSIIDKTKIYYADKISFSFRHFGRAIKNASKRLSISPLDANLKSDNTFKNS